ncbi:MAG: iron-containing alcohol dehydrogenase [Muribaculaceae bacterium]
MKNMKFNMFMPTKLVFGAGELKQLSTLPLPGKKAFIVISAGTAMKKYGYVDRVQALLKKNGIESIVFDKTLANPINSHVMEGAAICVKENCDFIIGLGGGSSIDSAKSIAVMAKNEGDYWDYIIGGTGKGMPTNGALPIIAIPTTAGTGTEVDPWTVISNLETNEKIGFGCAETFPKIAIVDPELMISVPPMFTAYQGFDAFFHASEGYIANCSSPISDLYALEAIRLLYKYLPVAINDGKDLKARTKVAWASTLAGMVESTSSCTSEHSLEHAMSAYYPALPHGAGLIAISHAYFKAFKNDSMKRYMKMSEAMTGIKSARPSDFIDALELMKQMCGVANIKLSEYGIKPEDFDKFADNARIAMGGLFNFDPRDLPKEEVVNIYAQSWK